MTSGPELVCPWDRSPLRDDPDSVVCEQGHRFPRVADLPVLLVERDRPTHPVIPLSLDKARGAAELDPEPSSAIHPMVSEAVGATCGSLYGHLVGRLDMYPIPHLPLPPGDGAQFLDIGCHWGRWTISAARSGYRAVGVDPSVEAIRAARSVAAQLDRTVQYHVADARRLPFPDESFDVGFSYSVFQHFRKEDVLASLRELRRVLRPGGLALVQMANLYGLRSLHNQLRRRRLREPRVLFDVRYWTPHELLGTFERELGPARLSADGFLSLNAQESDLELMPLRNRVLIRLSGSLRRASRHVPGLVLAADSLWVVAVRGGRIATPPR